ncbi:CLUMA_CG007668, isoform A [Clunio marinus]|uniref:CLUMA_CG007668, isoform A n=1 Tax=Clunio marinus TaxID=568069 RepID=A0A1J1I1J1_9DIPT|nr:CLUMA_CG007668, isoform A [Clunio marinus]
MSTSLDEVAFEWQIILCIEAKLKLTATNNNSSLGCKVTPQLQNKFEIVNITSVLEVKSLKVFTCCLRLFVKRKILMTQNYPFSEFLLVFKNFRTLHIDFSPFSKALKFLNHCLDQQKHKRYEKSRNKKEIPKFREKINRESGMLRKKLNSTFINRPLFRQMRIKYLSSVFQPPSEPTTLTQKNRLKDKSMDNATT